MGLDIVELVMATERTFNFHIPDEDACGLTTVGKLHEYVRANAPGASEDPELWEHLVDLIEKETGVRRDAIRPEATFVYDLRLD